MTMPENVSYFAAGSGYRHRTLAGGGGVNVRFRNMRTCFDSLYCTYFDAEPAADMTLRRCTLIICMSDEQDVLQWRDSSIHET